MNNSNHIKQYEITARSLLGGSENRRWSLCWTGDGWSGHTFQDKEYFDCLEEAKSVVDKSAAEFNEFVALSVDLTIFDEDGEILEDSQCVYEISGTKLI